MYSIILCGGSGTRLWPLSRKNYPKQFLNLYSDKSLLQETFLRMENVVPKDNIFFVTNEENHYNVLNQIKEIYPEIKGDRIIIEPVAHSTTSAMALAAKYLEEKINIKSEDSLIFVPSDHYIGKPAEFYAVAKTALKEVGDNIGTIGIVPTRPDTGLGYIKKGEKENNYFKVSEFKEKPDEETAKKYLDSGDYLWNAGMFLFNIETLKKEFKKYCPEAAVILDKKYEDVLAEFEKLPSEPFDTAIAEKSEKMIVFPADIDWSDIGSFDILSEILAKQKDANPKHVAIDSKNVFVYSANDYLIATLGVDDIIVVENNDSILVQKKGKSNEVRKVVEYLQEKNMPEVEDNIVFYRPWGKYEVLVEQPKYKVKKIIVYPGARLSLQSHQKRFELWVVAKGIAVVNIGEKVQTLKTGESVSILMGDKHRLTNNENENLEIIEVQSGDYLEEDDIVRYEDEYNRM